MRTHQPRHAQGSRLGGRFATKANPESELSIGDESSGGATLADESTHLHRNPDGSVGGVVSNTAVVGPEVTVSPDSAVLDFAVISGRAAIDEGSVVRDRACVGGTAHVRGSSTVAQAAMVDGRSLVTGGSLIDGEAHVTGDAVVISARVTNDGFVGGDRVVLGELGVIDDTSVSSNVTSDGIDSVPSAWLEEDGLRPHSGVAGRSDPYAYSR
jgi:carbonic anhydrase/acetyltransferase-like protein (isoleucine patch superfamily)